MLTPAYLVKKVIIWTRKNKPAYNVIRDVPNVILNHLIVSNAVKDSFYI